MENTDGSIAIFGENHDILPYSIHLEPQLKLMHCKVPLPVRIVVLPDEKPQLLTVFIPDGPSYSYSYSYRFDLGSYSGQTPDSSVVYALPFITSNDSIVPKRADKLYIYNFLLPKYTPILAARGGIVAAVKFGQKNTRTINSNLIYVYHDDGTHACYENLDPEKSNAIVKVGQRVKVGETIGYFGENKKNPYFWFSVEYPAATNSETIPVTFLMGNRLVRPN
ncbi:M23 family metallopeptidase [Hymenobacter wooponensis]|uniref:M23 family metallopeptidase n=1 Tax=Hymenobacter wooponensis TaxID=1525360 RepID=A0A4Z0MLA2_9BACT|nr:M23 family metallopeptidase [Hymenobacter wooponensis]TGD80266.1 M23 family metallopeptidase [Hymenobacter wooponensis]